VKILYGVQGTGNGHISRARAMANALASHPDITVHWLFSGRQPGQFFAMDLFGPHQRFCHGLTFATRGGRVDIARTITGLRPGRFAREVAGLDTRDFDLVVSDFEPVTAWAARLQGTPSVGLGHQYALVPGVPLQGANPLMRNILRYFAPTGCAIGLHWHHFNLPHILPPLLDTGLRPIAGHDGRILVYLPFESLPGLVTELRQLTDYRFAIYSPQARRKTLGNVELHPPGHDDFRRDLARADGIICNAGFMLLSEAQLLGKRVLAKPLAGQMEQLSNARALQALGLGSVCEKVDSNQVATWLATAPRPRPRPFPDVAGALAEWLADGCLTPPEQLAQNLWRSCASPSRLRPATMTNPSIVPTGIA